MAQDKEFKMTNYPFEYTRPHQKDKIFSVSYVPRKKLTNMIDEWQELLENSLEINPCYAPAFSLEIFKQQKRGLQSGCITIRCSQTSKEDKTSKLVGLLPISTLITAPFGLIGFAQVQTSHFSGSASPLFHNECETEVMEALFGWAQEFNILLRFKEFRLETPIGVLFCNHLEENKFANYRSEIMPRPAVILDGSNFEKYLVRLKAKTKQTLRRKKRQLEKLGSYSFTSDNHLAESPTLEEFIALEDASWKGQAGTSIAKDIQANQLVLRAIAQPDFPGARIDAIRLNGRAIAMTLHIGLGHSALFFKSAFDESLSKYSPGLLIHLETLEALLKEKWADHLDSCVGNTRSVSPIWQETVTSCTILISPKTTKGNVGFIVSKFTFVSLDRAKNLAKRVLSRFRH